MSRMHARPFARCMRHMMNQLPRLSAGSTVRRQSLVGRWLIFLVALVILWMVANILAGPKALDPFPFQELGFAISAAALAIAILILASQRRADRLADAREKMTLELALQSAQMVSKVIALLEELRRDTPSVPDRIDPDAIDMADRGAETDIHATIHTE